jgi:hypothetical protein
MIARKRIEKHDEKTGPGASGSTARGYMYSPLSLNMKPYSLKQDKNTTP